MNFLLLPVPLILKIFSAALAIAFLPPLILFGFSWETAFTVFSYTALLTVLILYWVGKTGWKHVWKKFDTNLFLSRNVFPDLNGIWEGKLKSNHFDNDAEPIVVKAKITMDLFSTRMIFEPTEYGTNSYTICSRLVKNPIKETFCLYYVYQAESPEHVETDERCHLGAAEIEISVGDREIKLSGHYWTDRKWRTRENTAGTVFFTREKAPSAFEPLNP